MTSWAASSGFSDTEAADWCHLAPKHALDEHRLSRSRFSFFALRIPYAPSLRLLRRARQASCRLFRQTPDYRSPNGMPRKGQRLTNSSMSADVKLVASMFPLCNSGGPRSNITSVVASFQTITLPVHFAIFAARWP